MPITGLAAAGVWLARLAGFGQDAGNVLRGPVAVLVAVFAGLDALGGAAGLFGPGWPRGLA